MISSTSHTLRFGSAQPAASSSSAQKTFSRKGPLETAYLAANDTYLRLKREDDHLKITDESGRTTVTPRVAQALRTAREADRQYRESNENKTTLGKVIDKLTNLVKKQ
jgi:hypothetical protein